MGGGGIIKCQINNEKTNKLKFQNKSKIYGQFLFADAEFRTRSPNRDIEQKSKQLGVDVDSQIKKLGTNLDSFIKSASKR